MTVFGLSELPAPPVQDGDDDEEAAEVSILWLLHPRLQTKECMAPFAAHLIHEWNAHRAAAHHKDHHGKQRGKQPQPQHQQQRGSDKDTKKNKSKGLIAITFDQRNHGSRLVDNLANEAWRSGNDRHALDMFSCYAGTAADVSLLLDYLPGYIFPRGSKRVVADNLVLGISLGGHAVWHVLCNDPRFSTGVSVIGCPDYARLMEDRARLSKRETWLEGKGKGFFGSKDFPESLVKSLGRGDPAGVVWGRDGYGLGPGDVPSDKDEHGVNVEKVKVVMKRVFGNKRVLVLSGGSDKLVSYKFSKPFLDWLRKVSGKGGWFEDGGLVLEDEVFDGVGHEVTPEMVERMVRFVNRTLAGGDETVEHGHDLSEEEKLGGASRKRRGSKI